MLFRDDEVKGERFADELVGLLEEPGRRTAMRAAAAGLAQDKAAAKLADQLEAVVR